MSTNTTCPKCRQPKPQRGGVCPICFFDEGPVPVEAKPVAAPESKPLAADKPQPVAEATAVKSAAEPKPSASKPEMPKSSSAPRVARAPLAELIEKHIAEEPSQTDAQRLANVMEEFEFASPGISKRLDERSRKTNLAWHFFLLFRGNDAGHYVWKGEKRYEAIERFITFDDVEQHLAGTRSLLSVPIYPHGQCYFGAIDLDRHGETDVPVDHTALAKRVTELGLPLVVCRSKSGKGAWLWLFLKGADGSPAEQVRRLLNHYAKVLELTGEIEIFPKQNGPLAEGQLGSGINLPYFSNDRIAFGKDGAELDLDGFLQLAQERQSFGGLLEKRDLQSAPAASTLPASEQPKIKVVTPSQANFNIAKALTELLARPPRDGAGRNEALTKASLLLGNYVKAGAVPKEFALNHLEMAARILNLNDVEIQKTVPRLLDEGIEKGGVELRDSSQLWYNAAEQIVVPHSPSFVDRLVYQNASTGLIGKPKIGKTTFALDMVESITRGSHFLKYETTPTSVLYISEQPLGSFQAELQNSGLLGRQKFSQLQLMKEPDARCRLYFSTIDKWFGTPWADIIDMTGAYAEKVDARLVIFDTLSRIARVENENDASEMQATIDALTPLHKEEIATLSIQHERKAGGEISDAGRGTNALTGAVDVILRLNRPVGNQGPSVRQLEVIGRFPGPTEPLILNRSTTDTTSRYEYLGNKAAVKRISTQQAIINLFGDDRKVELTEEEGVRVSVGGGRRSDAFYATCSIEFA